MAILESSKSSGSKSAMATYPNFALLLGAKVEVYEVSGVRGTECGAAVAFVGCGECWRGAHKHNCGVPKGREVARQNSDDGTGNATDLRPFDSKKVLIDELSR